MKNFRHVIFVISLLSLGLGVWLKRGGEYGNLYIVLLALGACGMVERFHFGRRQRQP